MARRRPRGNRQDYARTDRVGELLRQIIGSELDRIDDSRLVHVTITGVDVDNELSKATVYFDPLDPDDIAEAEAAFAELRGRLKVAIGSQAHIRRVPDLVFVTDHGVQIGNRVEEILAGLDVPPAPPEDDASAGDAGGDDASGDDASAGDASAGYGGGERGSEAP